MLQGWGEMVEGALVMPQIMVTTRGRY
ncbi:hypothetical protein BLAT2472_70289 [Burkholderia latens]